MSKQWKLGFVSFVVYGGQIQKHGGFADEIDLCMNLVDLLQEQADYNARRSLIEIMPVRTAVSMSQLLIFG